MNFHGQVCNVCTDTALHDQAGKKRLAVDPSLEPGVEKGWTIHTTQNILIIPIIFHPSVFYWERLDDDSFWYT